MARDPAGEDDAFEIGYWAVAFLDLLGYRDMLDRFDVFPLPEDEPDKQAVFDALGKSVRARSQFVRAMKMFMANPGSTKIDGSISARPDVKSFVGPLRQTSIVLIPGPDNVILGCPLAKRESHYPPRAIQQLVSSAAFAQVLQLGGDTPAFAVPLRGGLDVALGTMLPLDNEKVVYSPALTRAYLLECKKAKSPRIVVGDRFLEYLTTLTTEHALDGNSAEARVRRSTAQNVREMLTTDPNDGQCFIDFLGPAVRQYLPDETATTLVSNAWAFAQHCERTEQRQSVKEKYIWLVEYMRPRLEIWGVRP